MVKGQHLQGEIFSRTEKENRVESLPSPNSKKFGRLPQLQAAYISAAALFNVLCYKTRTCLLGRRHFMQAHIFLNLEQFVWRSCFLNLEYFLSAGISIDADILGRRHLGRRHFKTATFRAPTFRAPTFQGADIFDVKILLCVLQAKANFYYCTVDFTSLFCNKFCLIQYC